ncbi:FAD-binding oxidoreductase [Methylobacterium sp. Leaf466]|uniref:FAD-binding oxidoreductase n=1 Tax=Methylobacterium sp. Leaf466 TaxID=1736386 RepID=UPI0009E6DE11|nr:FAD-binding oxidoreductase [Methylobacterium sp. Leaf466]
MTDRPRDIAGPLGTLSGWGRYPRAESRILRAEAPDRLPGLVAAGTDYVARGNGRAYGDAAIGLHQTVLMRRLDRFRGFDPDSGRLTVEAGVLLADILDVVVPRGFFPFVVPGTRLVTVGGMIAADVHGKNHHREGGFGDHLDALTLLLPDGRPLRCSREDNPELFTATVGGMGLTGLIVDATFRLRPIESGWIRQETEIATNLSGLVAALDRSAEATYCVAWIDCQSRGGHLGRGLVFRGEHASAAECAGLAPPRAAGRAAVPVPVDMPSWTLNPLTVGAFNALYHRRGAAAARRPAYVPWRQYFFPLDGLSDWNRLYGRRGFVQHQCVIPPGSAQPVLAEILERVARLGSASPLAVLKRLGPGSGLLSFPMDGYTLALDLPANAAALALLDEIDRLVVPAGGRLYLAKDSRQTRATFEAGYPGLGEFRRLRRTIGAERRLTSHLSARLGV